MSQMASTDMASSIYQALKDGSFLIAFGIDSAGDLVVTLRVIDFGHANWKSQAAPRTAEVVGGKKWFVNKGKLTPGMFGCGASELLARLKALRAGKPLPSACMEKCLRGCKVGATWVMRSCLPRHRSRIEPSLRELVRGVS